MLRILGLSVSSLALFAASACAQEDTVLTPTTESAAATQSTTAEPATTADAEAAAIIDVAQVSTRDDAKLYAKSEFKQADLNGDASIDENEFIAYASVRAPVTEPAPMTTEPATEGAQAAAEAATAEQQFADISRGDDAISETEIVEARVSQFDEADANGDETLDATESEKFASLATPKPSATPL